MTLAERLSEYVRACFTGIWVQSFEHDDAIIEIARLCRQQRWSLATWDIDRGLSIAGADESSSTAIGAADPLAAIKAIGSLATQEGTALLVLRNFHRFLGSIEVVQALDTAISAGKQNRTILVILSPVLQIPSELERQFVVIEHDLPPREQIQQIARSIATEPGELPDGEGLGAVLDAAAGLTRVEAENAFSLSLIRHGRVTPDVLWELKAQTLKKSGLMIDPPWRRDLRRPGRPGRPEGVLQAIPGRQAVQLTGTSSGRPASRRARHREERPSARPWATRSGVRRSSSTSGR